MSILIGVNDVGHEFSGNNGVDAQKYEKIYSMMIEEIKAELPDIRIMIMEPFCLKGRATENTEERPDKWNEFNTELRIRAAKARAIAEKYGLPFIPLQQKLDDCSLKTGATYLLGDGVHPTAMGHELIAREWIKAFNEIK
ncbi:MAG: lysophospholipase, partial [Clostridia bacterium]|nr:lysophospholipase [Clostridia bacterium]